MENTKKNLKKRNKKGFTLIELVVVIAILGILAAILVPVISGFIETANQSTDNANARLVYQAAAMYYSADPASNIGDPVAASELSTYMGQSSYPTARQSAVSGQSFSASITSAGAITVTVGSLTYDPSTGKLS